jgi:signal transduction histidine kinase/DNA-binding response OmpR family regulator/HPt (histidine-containing phosphotransfer) domain-containing protein/tetratricopeptide (TPR) repeat protein
MDMFALNTEVTRLEALLAETHAAHQLPVLVTLAWHLRQRDSLRAEKLVQRAYALLDQADLLPAQRQGYATRLRLSAAEIHWLFARLDAAQEIVDTVLGMVQDGIDPIACADAHWLWACIAIDRGLHQVRDEALEKVIEHAVEGGDPVRVALAEACIARWAVFADAHAAEVRWGRRFSAAQDDIPPALACWVHDFRALVAMHNNDFAEAARHFLLARDFALQSGQLRAAIITSTNLGENFAMLNDHQSSLEWMQRGLSLARPTGWPRSVGACLMHTAETMRRLHQLEVAQELLDEALQILAPLVEARSYAGALLYQGNLALDRHDHALALDSFQRLQERADALNQGDFQIDARRGQAHALSWLKKPQAALEFAHQALLLAQQKNDCYREIEVLQVLASIHIQHNLPAPAAILCDNAALYYLQQAQNIGCNIEGYTIPGHLLDAISHEYAKIGRHAEAYELALEASSARERTHGELATNRAIALQVQQQTERAQAEGEYLRQLAQEQAERAQVLQRTSETLRHLSAIGQEITGSLNANAIFQVLNRHVHGLLDATSFSIFLLDSQGRLLQRAFGIEAGHPLPPRTIEVAALNSNAARCARERREIVFQQAPNTHTPSIMPGTMLTLSALFGPLMVGERMLGVMTVQAPHAYAYGEREQLIFRTLCAYGAIALDNAFAYRQLTAALETVKVAQEQLALAARTQTRLVEEKMQAEQMARQRAEETSRLKSDFLANMSHEIRTPMSAIIGMAHLALRTELNPKQQDYVSKIHRSGLSLLGILNDILDFSKIEAGKLDVETVPFFLDEVLANCASVTCQRAADKGLEYLFNVPHQVPRHLLGDPLRLGQVLINLVNNAIKFTERGEIELACRVVPDEPVRPGGPVRQVRLAFSIRDTGIGISAEQQAQLFQAFAQAERSTTRKYGGTGLGLSISRHLVHLMGGALTVDSRSGQGAVFSFQLDLPLANDATADSTVPAAPMACDEARVLVVDDHRLAANSLVEALHARPLRVDAVYSAPEALHAIMQADQQLDPYAVVLIDWQMPQMDGLELMRKIIGNDRLRKQPALVLVSAFGLEQVHEEAERIGVNGLLYKPINQSQLFDTLNAVFVPRQGSGNHAVSLPQLHFHHTRVLLAEDNDINQQIAIELMSVVGIEVDCANDGQEALDKLFHNEPWTYQLVLMDLEMPEMDGHATTRAIRADARFAQLPIVAMTAHALKEIEARCVADGMQDFLSKPINPERLYRMLVRWIDPGLRDDGDELPPPVEQVSGLPNLPGIDLQLGLSHVAGNTALYLHLLRRFLHSQHHAINQLRQHISQGERAAAIRDAHTLRGVGANLGAHELTHAAKLLERTLANPRANVPGKVVERHLKALEGVLSSLLSSLHRYFASQQAAELAQTAPGNDNQPLALSGARPECIDIATESHILASLLADFDAEAVDYFRQIQPHLQGAFSPHEVARLARAIDDYEFELALQRLQNLMPGFDN